MSKAASESSPKILINDEQQDSTAAGEEQVSSSSISQHDESVQGGGKTAKETQAKVQSVFEQVRTNIRSQVGIKVSGSSILELVQKIKERETERLQESSEPDGKGANAGEEEEAEVLKDVGKDELDLRLEMLCTIYDEKLEGTKKDLKNEFDVQISLFRKEMQSYTDQRLKDLESKMQSVRSLCLQSQSKPQQEVMSAERKPKPSAAPSLALRRGKVLTRTMTTIIPKTSAPIITGPRAKSEEILSFSKGQSSQVLLRDHVFSLRENKTCQSRNPLPPARPPQHQRKKTVQAKPKASIDSK